ncbi:LysR family transcriptional regulator [Vulcaniibacterium tengchongense]|uniref:LysR family transcriptional regulator n=1 Tax=Vulcaniibacterium tengchongense TaxID=1273429 RepID=A0A3N4W3D1_9GAMM|nr:LysR family transcriptional regulator [Vulcaniibacterium tengchongense]RPE79704.1 LysR family transcriptional regulator [Vulcaniibacterium tengchongense]
MDWDDLRIFLAVARHGSLGAAARALGTTQPTISRRLSAFERRVGAKLLERSRTGLAPSALGRALLENLGRMEENALAVERLIAAGEAGFAGKIAITSLDWLGDHLVAPLAARFATLNPCVDVELLNDARVYNLSRHEAHVAFRFGPFEQEDLVVRTLGEAGYGLYATGDYLERHGPPDFAAGCRGQAIATLYENAAHVPARRWLQALAPNARVVLHSNEVQALFAPVEAGVAMAALPRVVADRNPRLLRVAAPLPEPSQPIRIGFHAGLRKVPRIRALIDFAAAEFEARAGELKPPP